MEKIKVLLLSYDNKSGAGKVSERIHNCVSTKVKCDHQYLINHKKKFLGLTKIKSSEKFNNLKRKINRVLLRFNNDNNYSFKSPSIFPSYLSDEINKSKYDIIHITWINEFISIEDLGKITKPIVWSVCDMWPFNGYLHYSDYGKNAAWKLKNFDKSNFNFNKFNIYRKLKSWKKTNIFLSAPCDWMVNCLRTSAIFHKSKIYKIPHPVNQDIFKSLNKNKMREKYNLPKKKILILFNCYSGVNDIRKGWKYFSNANNLTKSKYEIVIIGQKEIKDSEHSSKKIYCFGRIKSETMVSEIINCVDFVVIPSLIDNLPQVGLEAQSCGKPIITFNNNGLKDLVRHKVDGYLAKKNNALSLAKGIDWTINNNYKNKLSIKCLYKAKKLYKSEVISEKYFTLYSKILKNLRSKR